MQIVDGDGLILLLSEAESQEVDTDLLAVLAPQQGGKMMFALKHLSAKGKPHKSPKCTSHRYVQAMY